MDALLALLAVAVLLLAFWRVGHWRWFWIGLVLWLATMELWAKVATGRTLSQQYWAWAQTSPWWWVPASLVGLGGMGLAVHLMWKWLKSHGSSR